LNCSTFFWWKVSSIHETLAQILFKNKALMVLEQEAFFLNETHTKDRSLKQVDIKSFASPYLLLKL